MKKSQTGNKLKTEIQKDDFISLEFTGRTSEGKIFDTNTKEYSKELNINSESIKPLTISIGHKMFLDSIEKYLIGKEIGKKYSLTLNPEEAFGLRKPELVKLIPARVFKEQQVQPRQGMVFNFDGQLGKIISASGGRIMVDFNNPLSGKVVNYELKVLNKIDNLDEKVKSVLDFFFRKQFDFEINEKDKKLIIKLKKEEKEVKPLFDLFKEKFKEILGLDLKASMSEEENSSEQKKQNESENNQNLT